jgi:hypothetical protein
VQACFMLEREKERDIEGENEEPGNSLEEHLECRRALCLREREKERDIEGDNEEQLECGMDKISRSPSAGVLYACKGAYTL